MKAAKITYYITTGLMSFAMLFSTYAYLTKPELKQAFQHLGFPDYFKVELAVAKFCAAIALWLPLRLLKENRIHRAGNQFCFSNYCTYGYG